MYTKCCLYTEKAFRIGGLAPIIEKNKFDMTTIQESSLEWALLHLTRYYDSDFFPRLFEFDAIKNDWTNVKNHILTIDLEKHAPTSPLVYLAPKPNGNFRVVHQLDPIDSLIFTALIYENSSLIESFRIPEHRNIACSYRIKPDLNGSFFEKDSTGYHEFINSAEKLVEDFETGFVLVCDITDFYNQIYLHRVNNVYNEAGTPIGKIIEDFLSGLNTNISKGIPVGPAASIIIAEAIMADIDKKILSYTDKFTRYVDDIYIFFDTIQEAKTVLHDLTKYLYSNHRLVFSSDKTTILTSIEFHENYLKNDETIEKQAIHTKLEELAFGDYAPREELAFDKLEDTDKFKVRSEAYKELFPEAIKLGKVDLGLMRHLLRQAGRYKIRTIIPDIFLNFDNLLPVLREIVIYFDRVLTDRVVIEYEVEFSHLIENKFIHLPFVNLWIFTLLQHKSFNAISLEINYSKIIRIREQAFIALRKKDTVWLKDKKDGLDTLGFWDKRAILFAASILSLDEMRHWLGLESSKGDIVNKAICSKVIANKKTKK